MSIFGKKIITYTKYNHLGLSSNILHIKGINAISNVSLPPSSIIVLNPLKFKLLVVHHISQTWGTLRAVIKKQVICSMLSYRIKIKLIGLGYKVYLTTNSLIFRLGYSKSIRVYLPTNFLFLCPKPNKLIIYSSDSYKLTQFEHLLQSLRPLNPYTIKGIFVIKTNKR